MRRLKILLLLFGFFLITGFAFAKEEKEVVVDGYGAIVEGDTAKARKDAIKDAKRVAVEQVMGTLVKSETLVENFQLVKDKILTKSEGYAKLIEVLQEGESAGMYKVKARIQVMMKELKEDLDELFGAVHYPRIMVVIPEQHIGRRVPDPAGETEIIKKLLKKGFKVVDQNQVKQIRENDAVKAAVEGDNKAAALLAREYGAEVIIIGEAFSEFNMEIGGLKSCRARVEARAINADTAEILAADGIHEAGVDATESLAGKKALQNAGTKMGDYMIEEILSKWTASVTKFITIQIVAKVKNYSQFKEFKRALERLEGFQDVDQRSFTANVGKLDLRIQTTSGQDLADEIEGIKLKTGKVEVTSFTQNRIDVTIR